jgi:hypothetical protein
MAISIKQPQKELNMPQFPSSQIEMLYSLSQSLELPSPEIRLDTLECIEMLYLYVLLSLDIAHLRAYIQLGK